MMIFSSLKLNKIQWLTAALLGLLFVSSCSKDDDDDYTGNWAVSYEFEGVGRTEAVSFTIDDVVYIGLGYDGDDRLTDFWAFYSSTGTWKRVATFPGAARSGAAAFVVDGKGYVGSGYDGTSYLSDFWSYDPDSDSWTEVADLSTYGGVARDGAVAFTLGSKGYICTGGNDDEWLKDLWEYDPTANTWTQKASLAGSKRKDAVAFVYNNKAYVVTGTNNSSLLTDFYYYDQSSDSWTRLRNINSSNDDESYDDDYGDNIKRSNASIILLSNKAYLCCGYKSGTTNTVWQYNIDDDTWEQKTSFEGSARQGAIGFSAGGVAYITTGTSGSTYFDDLWSFDPSADQDSDDNY
ncbi:MAG: kelch repeat-containing protein [Niabella sp.]